MYSILVADDEAIIREGIKCLFDYEALGFSICAEAVNGQQALDKILTLEPDVVLMDIRMPGISGLDVLAEARARGYQGHVVIISGFSDFHYAQEAMRHGVGRYLTKPIDEAELEKVLLEFKTVLDARNQVQNYRRRAREPILRDILLGESQITDTRELEISAERYQVVLCQQYHSRAGELPVEQLLSLFSPGACDHIPLRSASALLLKGAAAQRQFSNLLARWEDDSRPRDPLLSGLYITYGQSVSSLTEIPLSYRQALALQDRRFFRESGRHTAGWADARPLGVPIISDALLGEYAARLLDCLNSFNRRKLAEALADLQTALRGSADTVSAVKLFMADLYLQIKEQISRQYPSDLIPFDSNSAIIQSIQQAGFLYEIIQYLAERFEAIMSATGISTRESVLDDILHYIRHNYASNITLENIAPLFGYNRSYLGKIFSKKMGRSFNSYVDQVRIDRAKELLQGGDTKVYTVAEMVGYKNVDYFHIKFKKYVGCSPAEFRKRAAEPQLNG